MASSTKKRIVSEWVAAILFMAAIVTFVSVFSYVTLPKRTDYGANWGAFLREEKNSVDVMFFGSSVVYCDIVPSIVAERTGLSAYVMAGPEQTIPITYYYIRETYRTQNPSKVFVDVTAMFFSQYTNFTKANIGYMPWSLNRIAATFAAAEPEERLGLLFPPFNYHDRWPDVNGDSFKAYAPDENRGYTMLTEANDVGEIRARKVDFDADSYENNLTYLRKIIELCEQKGSKLIYYISPAYGRWEDEYLEKLSRDVADMGYDVIDFNRCYDEIGIEENTEYFDFLHLTYDGAVRFTSYLTDTLLP